MSASAVVFYILSFFILATGLLAVTSRKIFRSAIWLLFSLTGIAGLYFWLQMEFIAAVQIVVYVGGIVVLIIFSIFLTQQSGKDLPPPVRGRAVFSALAVCAGFALTCVLLRGYAFRPAGYAVAGAGPGSGGAGASVGNIGAQLLSTTEHGYVLPFEVISILLLAAMVGCIVIAIKTKPEDQ
ncbi:MAG TPA: NADH-quinone oxidoreductase subunit J [Puia sp.]|jgi:NADH-quinone oxidoreductase subunit J|nr:NADH-quinone oxidoreductase subunit J [Puia sp.]